MQALDQANERRFVTWNIFLIGTALTLGLFYGCNREMVEKTCPVWCEYYGCKEFKVELDPDWLLYSCNMYSDAPRVKKNLKLP